MIDGSKQHRDIAAPRISRVEIYLYRIQSVYFKGKQKTRVVFQLLTFSLYSAKEYNGSSGVIGRRRRNLLLN